MMASGIEDKWLSAASRYCNFASRPSSVGKAVSRFRARTNRTSFDKLPTDSGTSSKTLPVKSSSSRLSDSGPEKRSAAKRGPRRFESNWRTFTLGSSAISAGIVLSLLLESISFCREANWEMAFGSSVKALSLQRRLCKPVQLPIVSGSAFSQLDVRSTVRKLAASASTAAAGSAFRPHSLSARTRVDLAWATFLSMTSLDTGALALDAFKGAPAASTCEALDP
mmetsp:Transcript_94409/g.131200  ORF Transcript_94409/g.131200 Transcript_94409/m.131200 type:complete len:224 (-) Transcript_94409:50-721(-)